MVTAAALTCATGALLVHASGAVLAVAGVVAVAVGGGLTRQALRHQHLVRGLLAVTRPAELNGVAVRLGPVRDAAFVAGLLRPRIFFDARLASGLSEEELRAVTLHEAPTSERATRCA